jgi:hypothetical protein
MEISFVFWDLILLIESGLVKELVKPMLIIGRCALDSLCKFVSVPAAASMELPQIINSGLEMGIMPAGKESMDGSRMLMLESMVQL